MIYFVLPITRQLQDFYFCLHLLIRAKQTRNNNGKIFRSHWNNIQNTWKGIKPLISQKTAASSVPIVLSFDNFCGIANTFNNYFASIAETIKKIIQYSHKHVSDYLPNESSSTIFLKPTDKEEIANIISSLNSHEVSGPKRIPYRILVLLNK